MKKISLIICFYNAEEFIERALKSFVDYLTDDIEVVLVDDGSTDSSLGIINKYMKKHNQIIIVKHEVNKGLSLARKTGVENSSGQYVIFLDADDEFILNPFGLFLENKNLSNFDLIEFKAVCEKTLIESKFSKNYYPKTGKEYLNSFFKGDLIIHPLWLRYYKRELLDNTIFIEKYELNEDSFALPLIFSKAKSIYFLDKVVLKQYLNPSSITGIQKSFQNKARFLKLREDYSTKRLEILNHLDKNLDVSYQDKFYKKFRIMLYLSYIKYSSHLDFDCVKKTSYELIDNYKDFKSFFNSTILFTHKSLIRNIILFILGTNITSYLIRNLSKIKLKLVKIQ